MKLFLPSAGLALSFAQDQGFDSSYVANQQRIRNAKAYEISSLLENVIPDLEDSIPANGLKNYGCTGV